MSLLVIAAPSAFAEEAAEPSTQTATISGVVTDAQTGEPLPGINVRPALVNGEFGWQPLVLRELMVATDATGTYTIENVPPGRYYIESDNFPTWDYMETYYPDVARGGPDPWVWATWIDVYPGDNIAGIDIRLTKYALLSGRTVDETTGEVHLSPVYGGPDIALWWWRYDERTNRWVIQGGTGGPFGDHGDLANRQPGRWKFSVSPVGPIQLYAFDWYGGDTLGEAHEFVFQPGQSYDVTIPVSLGQSVSGVIRAPDGVTPVESARVHAFAYDEVNDSWEELRLRGDARFLVYSGPDGSYTITHLPSGTFRIGAVAPGYAFTFFGDTVYPGQAADITLDAVESTVTATNMLSLSGASGYNVTLRRGGGTIKGHATCSDWRAPTSIMVDALSFDPAHDSWEPIGRPTMTGDDGTYQLQLPAGEYKVRFRRSGSAPRYNGGAWTAASAPAVRVSTGKDVSGIDATLISGGSSTCSADRRVARYGSPANFSIDIRDWRNQRAAGLPVVLQRSTDRRTYTTVAKGTTSSSGLVLRATTSGLRTYFRWSFPGRIDKNPPVVVYQSADVGIPQAPAKMSRSRYYAVSGILKPKHEAGTYPVRIHKWKRTANGSWEDRGYVYAKASDYQGHTRYARSIRLSEVGKWRLRAYTPQHRGHLGAWSSGYDYVTVE